MEEEFLLPSLVSESHWGDWGSDLSTRCTTRWTCRPFFAMAQLAAAEIDGWIPSSSRQAFFCQLYFHQNIILHEGEKGRECTGMKGETGETSSKEMNCALCDELTYYLVEILLGWWSKVRLSSTEFCKVILSSAACWILLLLRTTKQCWVLLYPTEIYWLSWV